jgi:hypothetical protein
MPCCAPAKRWPHSSAPRSSASWPSASRRSRRRNDLHASSAFRRLEDDQGAIFVCLRLPAGRHRQHPSAISECQIATQSHPMTSLPPTEKTCTHEIAGAAGESTRNSEEGEGNFSSATHLSQGEGEMQSTQRRRSPRKREPAAGRVAQLGCPSTPSQSGTPAPAVASAFARARVRRIEQLYGRKIVGVDRGHTARAEGGLPWWHVGRAETACVNMAAPVEVAATRTPACWRSHFPVVLVPFWRLPVGPPCAPIGFLNKAQDQHYRGYPPEIGRLMQRRQHVHAAQPSAERCLPPKLLFELCGMDVQTCAISSSRAP